MFTYGICMLVIVAAENADAACTQLQAAGESVSRVGTIRARVGDEHQAIVI